MVYIAVRKMTTNERAPSGVMKGFGLPTRYVTTGSYAGLERVATPKMTAATAPAHRSIVGIMPPFRNDGVFKLHSLSHTPKKPATAPPPTELTAPIRIWASRLLAMFGLGWFLTAKTAPTMAPLLLMASSGGKMVSTSFPDGHGKTLKVAVRATWVVQ